MSLKPTVRESNPLRFFHSRLLYGYFTPYMRKAKEEGSSAVAPDKLPELWENDDVKKWAKRFVRSARQQWERPGGPSQYALLLTLVKVFWRSFLWIVFVSACDIFLNIATITLLGKFLEWQEFELGVRPKSYYLQGAFYCSATLLTELFKVFVKSQLIFWRERVALRVEGALSTALFRRILLPPHSSEQYVHTSYQQLDDADNNMEPKHCAYNVLMVDVPCIARALYLLAEVFTIPLLLGAGYRVLNTKIGPPAVVGLSVSVFTVLVILCLEIYNGFLRKPLLHYRDARLDRTHEVLSEAKALRMVGWQSIACEGVNQARMDEMRVRKTRMYIHGVSWGVSDNIKSLVQVTTLCSYVIWGLRSEGSFVFKASVAIPVMQVVVKLVEPLSKSSWIAHAFIEAGVSVNRYQTHLFGTQRSFEPKLRRLDSSFSVAFSRPDDSGDECTGLLTSATESTVVTSFKHKYIQVQDALYSWTSESLDDSEWSLKKRIPEFRINIKHLELEPGECMFLLGEQGSGKSSFILALLGEMIKLQGFSFVSRPDRIEVELFDNKRRYHGEDELCTSVGYTTQIPWIPEGNVRSTILFGRPYDDIRYNNVIKACDLQADFDYWGECDSRVVLQGGQNLSGGQRSRVALARAVYDYPVPYHNSIRGSKCFFLDDPLCSIDPRVGCTIFNSLFGSNGLLIRAATIMTIDESSLMFYLQHLLSTDTSPIKFSIKILNQGSLSNYPIGEQLQKTLISTTIPPPKPVPESPISVKDENPILSEDPAAEEHSFSGDISTETYLWFGRRIGICLSLLACILAVSICISQTSTSFWVAYWSTLSHNGKQVLGRKLNTTIITTAEPAEPHEYEQSLLEQFNATNDDKTKQHSTTMFALSIFLGFSLFSILGQITLTSLNAFTSVRTAITVHNDLLKNVINAPFWLYDYISVGVLLNRFSSDMHQIDSAPIHGIVAVLDCFTKVILVVIALAILSPWCSPLIPLIGFAVYQNVYLLYRPSCRELQRAKLVAYSPLCDNFSEAETGSAVIRAFGAEVLYTNKNIQLTRNLIKIQFFQSGSNNWATLRLQLLAFPLTLTNFIIPSLSSAMNFSSSGILTGRWLVGLSILQSPGFVGLALDYATRLPKLIGDCALGTAMVARTMCSVQRVRELMTMASTDGSESLPVIHSYSEFPVLRSGLRFSGVSVAYQRIRNLDISNNLTDPNPDFALSSVSVYAAPGQHVGIVGRSGAGKSTIILSILNLVHVYDGAIYLDGIRLPTIKRSVINELIGVLPQAPVILKGWTLRKFLDPCDRFNIDQLMAVVKCVGMLQVVLGLPDQLETVLVKDEYEDKSQNNKIEQKISKCAKALSDSQLRIFSIARLALRADQFRLVVVDEPPPKQIDGNTEDISHILKQTFPKTTVIIVAHHASTIRNCDVVWIFSKGRFVEQIDGSTIKSQDDLMNAIRDAENRFVLYS